MLGAATRALSGAGLVTYAICCLGNWGTHLWWFAHCVLAGELNAVGCLYFVAILFVANDDRVLMKWLYNYQRGQTSGGGAKKGEENGLSAAAAAAAARQKQL